MPRCIDCGLVAASAEMRRLKAGGHHCKDRYRCKQRVADLLTKGERR